MIDPETTATVERPACRNYFPGDPYRRDQPCSSCNRPLTEHAVAGSTEVGDVALRVYRLLTHYGHHCTVQNLLPDLRAALIANGVTPDELR